jgi:hypothetical protein
MDPKSIKRLVGKLAAERGRARERHVLAACALGVRPAWMRSARAATRREDHRGIDVVIESDVGKLFVQVKSSIAGKAKFEGRRRSARIVVVVVDAGDSLEAVLGMVVGGVGEVRGEYVRERGGGRASFDGFGGT